MNIYQCGNLKIKIDLFLSSSLFQNRFFMGREISFPRRNSATSNILTVMQKVKYTGCDVSKVSIGKNVKTVPTSHYPVRFLLHKSIIGIFYRSLEFFLTSVLRIINFSLIKSTLFPITATFIILVLHFTSFDNCFYKYT